VKEVEDGSDVKEVREGSEVKEVKRSEVKERSEVT
jgi:hypothetical protein